MIFRRVRGHIIPIDEKRERAKAQAKAAAGVGAALLGAAATGHIAGDLERKANRAHEASVRSEVRAHNTAKAPKVDKRGQMSLFGVKSFRSRTQYMEMASKHQAKSEKLREASKLVNKAGHHAAGAAVAAASYHLLGQTKFKDDEKTKAAVGVAAGVSTSFAINHAHHNKLGANLSFGKMVKTGLKKAAVEIGRFAIRRKMR